MKRISFFLVILLIGLDVQAQWLNFEDQTGTRINISNINDNDDSNAVDDMEKDLAVGDFDQDGFVDLIVVRKRPFSTAGARTDLLLMNRNGVLEDETDLYAPEFLTDATDARDVIVVDVNNDNWPDLFIISTFGDQPKLYLNQGNDTFGDWQGFDDESTTRLPTVTVDPIQFCAGWAGDLTGNNFPDLYMVNYSPSVIALDILFVNDGTGNFTEETQTRMGDLRNSSFGTGVEFHDVDNDNDLDIVKNLGLNTVTPFNAKGPIVLFNNGDGTFTNFYAQPENAAYMVAGGDLNNNGLVDFYVVDDSQDYVNRTTSFTVDQSLTIAQYNIPTNRTDGFGGNVKLIDLDDDGDLDVGLSSVDTDIPPCETNANRRFILFENDGVHSGDLVHPYGATMNPWNISTYDHDYIDLNNDGLLDIILGACDDYRIFIQEETLSLDNNLLTNGFKISPNPTTGMITISLNFNPSEKISMQLLDVTGKVLNTMDVNQAFELTRKITFDIGSKLSNGLYYLKMQEGSSVLTKKIVIN